MVRTRRPVPRSLGVALVGWLVVLAGCGKPADAPSQAQREVMKAENLQNEDRGLDPHTGAPLPDQERAARAGLGDGSNGVGGTPAPVVEGRAALSPGADVKRLSSAAKAITDRKQAGGTVALADPKAPAPQPKGDGIEPPSGGEQYGKIVENEFRSPKAAPLSTFSADVNTASYSNARRFLLDQSTLPPKDSVYLAEFVNYFPYQYERPKGDDPVALDLAIGPCPWRPKHHLVRVGVQAKQFDAAEMPARNLVFLVDTSGSMSAPNRLPLVVRSLKLLIDTLTPKDTVSLVTYAGTAGITLEPTKGSEKEKLHAAVERLSAGGSTNGAGGIAVAYDLAVRSFVPGGVNRVILCTDGDFNVGVSNRGDLVRMIEERRRTGVFLTVLGFGMGNYKDATLKDLANHGNGHHAYIDSIEEARKVFVEQGGALVVVAKDVKFQVEFNPARVLAYRLLGYENRLLRDEDFRNDAKDAGEMGSGHQVTVLYEVVPVGVPFDVPGVDPLRYQAPTGPPPGAADEWLTVKMRYKAPDGEVSKELKKSMPGDAFRAEPSAEFRFAAAVASFGQLLRDSPHKGLMTYASIAEDAAACVGPDPNGHRKGFLELVRRAAAITAPPRPAAAVRD